MQLQDFARTDWLNASEHEEFASLLESRFSDYVFNVLTCTPVEKKSKYDSTAIKAPARRQAVGCSCDIFSNACRDCRKSKVNYCQPEVWGKWLVKNRCNKQPRGLDQSIIMHYAYPIVRITASNDNCGRYKTPAPEVSLKRIHFSPNSENLQLQKDKTPRRECLR